MENKRAALLTPRLVIGFVLIALGVLFTLDKLGYTDARGYFRYWPVLLIAIGASKVFQRPGRGFGILLILLGFWFQLNQLGMVRRNPWDLWPLLLVFIGGSLIWKAIGWTPRPGSGSSRSRLEASALLGGSKHRITSSDFRGGEATAILGGCTIDLKDASTAGGKAVIDAFAFCGGVEILVSDDWGVELRGKPILGAFEDNRTRSGTDPKNTLVVQGTAILGGVEVKN